MQDQSAYLVEDHATESSAGNVSALQLTIGEDGTTQFHGNVAELGVVTIAGPDINNPGSHLPDH